MNTTILGLSAFYHDSAAALVQNGHIIAATQEERFTRKKHDAAFPKNAIEYCLSRGKLELKQVDYIVFYDKPFVKFERLLETYLSFAPQGIHSFLKAMPLWLKEKLFLKKHIKQSLSALGRLPTKALPPLLFTEHHQAHAASTFFPSPFQRAAVLCLDGVGEWATSSLWLGEKNKLTPQWELDFPHSLGLLYSAFTYYTGFKVNSGEYKLMGLAPYGNPRYVDRIYEHLLDLKEDGTFKLNLEYFQYPTGLKMTNQQFDALFQGPARTAESDITQREMDIASSIQAVTEEIILRLARTAKKELQTNQLCLAGGVALNCVANGKIAKKNIFKEIFIQPAAGDAGGALGAALSVWYEYLNKPRTPHAPDSLQGSYLGPHYTPSTITTYLTQIGANYHVMEKQNDLLQQVADLLTRGYVIGWFQGRMEFGPRALGARSILGDPRDPTMQSTMNLKIKYRESFRPFAPVIKYDKVSEWFAYEGNSPYMLMVAPVHPQHCFPLPTTESRQFGIEKLQFPRSTIPAVTHVDYSARIQTVHPETNPLFYALLDAFEKKTGCPILINTSFNVRGEPIVCTPQDAYQCFMRTEMDYLIMENIILDKKEQNTWKETGCWKNEFTLD